VSYGKGAIKCSELLALNFNTKEIEYLSREHPAVRLFAPTTLTEDVRLQLTPNTKTGKTLLGAELVFAERWSDGNHIHLKGALYDKDSDCFNLITATTDKELVRRGKCSPTESHQKGWFIGQYRMAASLSFWRELQMVVFMHSRCEK